MQRRNRFTLFFGLAILYQCIGLAQAHTFLWGVTTNGVVHGMTQCIRPYITRSTRTYPVRNVTSTDLTCRTSNMDASATEDCPIEAGSAITLQWCHTGANCSNPISQSHTGPIMAYMAPLDSNGAGDVWFKIYEEGWDNTTKQWSTDKLIANAGKRDVIIPSYLKAGNYLLRSEIIALHDARVVGGAQFFPNCVQLTVTGNGNIVPTGVAIPGAYGERDPGILYSRSFTDNSGYVIPGPPVYVPDGSNSTTTGNTSSEVQSSSEPSVQSSEPTPSPSSSASAASTPTSTSVASPVNLTPTSSVSKCRPRPTSAKCMKGSGGVARRMAKRTVLPSPTPEQQQQQQRRAEL